MQILIPPVIIEIHDCDAGGSGGGCPCNFLGGCDYCHIW